MSETIIRDELTAETFTGIAANVLRLDGAIAAHFPFAEARGRDGQVADADTFFRVTAVSGTNRVTTKADFTPGATPTLTLRSGAGNVSKTSAAGTQVPDFNGLTGVVKLVAAVEDYLTTDETGGLYDNDPVRKAATPATLEFVRTEEDAADDETIFAAGVETRGDVGAGGFSFVDDETEPDDGVDVRDTSTPGVKLVRQTQKLARSRHAQIPDGAFYLFFGAADPRFTWNVDFATRDGALSGAAVVHGDGADPRVVVSVPETDESQLKFDLSGTGVGVRNTSGGTLNISYTYYIATFRRQS